MKNTFVEPHVLDWKTSQLLQLFFRKALPGFLAYCVRDLVVLGSTALKKARSPWPWEAGDASALLQ